MKRLLLLIFAASSLGALAVTRNITESWDIARTPRTPQEIYFLQAESIQFDLSVYENGEPYALTNAGLVVVWELSLGDNYTNLVAVGTGTVVSATGGVVRLTLTPEQSNLTNGTYNGYVIAAVSDGTNLTDRVVLARQDIEVTWSPYGLEYDYVGLQAPFYTISEIDGMTNGIYGEIGYLVATNAAQYTVNTNIEARVAVLEALPEIPTNAVTSIVLNDATNAPIDGVVDLGTVEVDVTNVYINVEDGGVAVYSLVVSTNQLLVSGAGVTNCNGIYSSTNSTPITGDTIYTNTTGMEIWNVGGWAWYLSDLAHDYNYYIQEEPGDPSNPWDGEWDILSGAYDPAPSVSLNSSMSEIANLVTNAVDIATNAVDIATNAVDIATNALDIAANTVLTETNALDIAANTVLTETNAIDIATNAVDIATNVIDIATNASVIASRNDLITDVNEKVGLMSYLSATSNTTCTTAGTWYTVEGVFSNKVMEGFTQTSTNYVCTSAITNWYLINWSGTFTADTGTTTVHLGVHKSDDAEYCCIQATLCKTADEEYGRSGAVAFELTSGDTIALSVYTDGDGDVITFEHATMSVMKLFPVRE